MQPGSTASSASDLERTDARISVGVKTFLRPEALRACLGSLCEFIWRQVIVVNDSPEDTRDEYERVYAEFEGRLPLRIITPPIDSGTAVGRNIMVEYCTADYLLTLDDDIGIDGSIRHLVEILDADPSLGGVSGILVEEGKLKCGAADLFVEDQYIVKEIRRRPVIDRNVTGQRYAKFDFIPQTAMFRTSCLAQLGWDPAHKIGREHIDFFLSHKSVGTWRFAVCLDTYIYHLGGASKGEAYRKIRYGGRVAESEEYLRNKHNVFGLVVGRQYIGGRRFFTRLHSLGASVERADRIDRVARNFTKAFLKKLALKW